MRAGRAWLPLLAAAIAVLGCDLGEPETAASCVAVVNVGGTFYGTADQRVQADFQPGELVLTVSANTGCNDVITDDEPRPDGELADGESNFLAVGTPIYEAPGFDPAVLLVAQTDDGWLELMPTQ